MYRLIVYLLILSSCSGKIKYRDTDPRSNQHKNKQYKNERILLRQNLDYLSQCKDCHNNIDPLVINRSVNNHIENDKTIIRGIVDEEQTMVMMSERENKKYKAIDLSDVTAKIGIKLENGKNINNKSDNDIETRKFREKRILDRNLQKVNFLRSEGYLVIPDDERIVLSRYSERFADKNMKNYMNDNRIGILDKYNYSKSINDYDEITTDINDYHPDKFYSYYD